MAAGPFSSDTQIPVDIADGELAALAGLTSSANKVPYFTASETAAVTDLTAYARTLIDDTTAVAARATLGVGPITKTVVVSTVVTAAAVATQELLNDALRRIPMDLSNFTSARLCASVLVAGSAGTKLGIQYSIDSGATWVYLDGTADGALAAVAPQVTIDSTGPKSSAYMTLHAAAKTTVLLRLVTQGGNASASPSLLVVNLEVK